jgi:ATP-dependent Lon protease
VPKDNERDVQMTPDYVKNKIKVRFVSSIGEVLAAALLDVADQP